MNTAFISDIHSNLPAFEAVLARIDSLGVDEIVCLGDVLGYGPHPLEVLALARERCSLILAGNHEGGILDPDYLMRFRGAAVAAINWTIPQLSEEDIEFLRTLEPEADYGEVKLFHGAPSDPMSGYLTGSALFDPDSMQREFRDIKQVGFGGHTHKPGVLEYSGPGKGACFTPSEELGYSYRLQQGRLALVNVGSVGQPRNNDTRASFVTFDGATVNFHTVEYDFASTVSDIRFIDDLPNYLADRLETGS